MKLLLCRMLDRDVCLTSLVFEAVEIVNVGVGVTLFVCGWLSSVWETAAGESGSDDSRYDRDESGLEYAVKARQPVYLLF